MQGIKRTTMFQENKLLGHKHILCVDCIYDNQALIMQQTIGIVKIHEILLKHVKTDTLLLLNRYVTQLFCHMNQSYLTDDRVFTDLLLLLIFEDISHYKTYVLFKLLYILSWIT